MAVTHRPADGDALAALVAERFRRRAAARGDGPPRLRVRGGGSKAGLLGAPQAGASVAAQEIDLAALSGVLAYEPSEFTVSVRAGTPLAEVAATLAAHGQALPFDPPFIDDGATAGGAVAAGLAGPGRLRGGGVRDAVLAVRFVDGRGRHARAGAPVVKNAAGFDLPKLFVGSLGRLAILTEVTFKVLPTPRAFATALFDVATLAEARDAAVSLLGSPFELDGLELFGSDGRWRLAVRLGGDPQSLQARRGRLARRLGLDPISDAPADEATFWRRRRDARWAGDRALAWIPTRVADLAALDAVSKRLDAEAAYAGGLAHAWLALEAASLPELDGELTGLGLAGLVVRPGAAPRPSTRTAPRLGQITGERLLRRVRRALDPADVFPDF